MRTNHDWWVPALMLVGGAQAGAEIVEYDGPPDALENCDDPRVSDFVRGRAPDVML